MGMYLLMIYFWKELTNGLIVDLYVFLLYIINNSYAAFEIIFGNLDWMLKTIWIFIFANNDTMDYW